MQVDFINLYNTDSIWKKYWIGSGKERRGHMKEINIAKVIQKKRKERHLTQDDIAAYIGVSKASVSKWETAQSYPDITFLPQLAALFNISIDELLGYEPQLTKTQIRTLYCQLSERFATDPFEEVLGQCREIIKEYYSCFPLLLQMGILLVNHCMLATGSGEPQKILEEARALFVRIRAESGEIELIKQAGNMEAVCLLSLGKPDEVAGILDRPDSVLTPQETLLSMAYEMTGKTQEAKAVCQVGIYQYLIALFSLMSHYQGLCGDDRRMFDETQQRMEALAETFRIQELHPVLLFPYYLCMAQNYAGFGETRKACEYLERYERLAGMAKWPLKLHGDAYFTLLDEWLEDTMPLGNDMPRDEKLVRKSMVEAVSGNPVFAVLAEDAQFQAVVGRLKACEEQAL